MVEKARAGKQVVRLKGGDPFVFGRGAEEAQALAAAKMPFVVVPGITSAIAGPAYAGIPVTHRGKNSHVTFFTGHEDPEKSGSSIDFAALAKLGGTQVMLMGVERIEAIAREMLANGMRSDLPVALIRWATTGSSGNAGRKPWRILLGSWRKEDLAAPAVAVFGEVVALRNELSWFEGRPLSGKRIVVTRTRSQAGVLSRATAGARRGRDRAANDSDRTTELICARFAELVQDAHAYDWIVFTSPNGVTAFFEMFYKLYDDAREIGGARIAAIGPATAQRIKEFHLKVDLQPEEFVAESVVREVQRARRRGKSAHSPGASGKGAGFATEGALGIGSYCGRRFRLPHGPRNAR